MIFRPTGPSTVDETDENLYISLVFSNCGISLGKVPFARGSSIEFEFEEGDWIGGADCQQRYQKNHLFLRSCETAPAVYEIRYRIGMKDGHIHQSPSKWSGWNFTAKITGWNTRAGCSRCCRSTSPWNFGLGTSISCSSDAYMGLFLKSWR